MTLLRRLFSPWPDWIRFWRHRPLAFKFLAITTTSVIAVELLLGAYFSYFISHFFEQATTARITKGFERLTARINEMDRELRDALMLLAGEDALLPSIQLINDYQNVHSYNRFLIDEEKRLVASRLLVRTRFALKSNCSLYDAGGQLVAAVNLEGNRYRLRYLSFANNTPTIMSRLEGQADSDYAVHADMSVALTTGMPGHRAQVDDEKATVQLVRLPDGITVRSSQYVVDPKTKNAIGRVELSENVNQAYLDLLSRDSGIAMQFLKDRELPQQLEVLDATKSLSSLRVSEDQSAYVAAVGYRTINGSSVITARLEKKELTDALGLIRLQLLTLLIVVTAVAYVLYRSWIRTRIGQPLALVMAQIERIQRHDFQSNERVNTGDELEDISQSLLSLSQQLRDRAIALQHSREEEAQLVRTLAAERDSLEQKVAERTEELLLAKNQADAASLAKSTFLANMSHEIRTPMTAITGLTYLLSRSTLDPHQSGQVERIAVAGQHLLSVINDILDFSKIEAGKVELEQMDFNVEEMVTNVCDLVVERALAKRLELVVRIDRFPPMLFGDLTRIEQILINLVNNAVKFTEEGTVVVAARVEDANDQKMHVRFEVRDTGIGISEEGCERIFQAFGQADVSTTRKYGGTGLGLAICQRLCKLMGGKIGVTSVLGQGSTFWVEIPMQYSHANWPSYLSDISESDGRDFLVLDERQESRTAIADCLTMLGHRVESVDSVESLKGCVDRWAAMQADQLTILIDKHGNWNDMADLARTLRGAFGSGTRLYLVGMCYRALDAELQSRDLGLDGMLGKPTAPGLLHRQLMRLWGGSHADDFAVDETTYEKQLSQYSGLRILMAEDNDFNQEIAIEVLGMVGIVPDVASNGQEAVQRVAQRTYDLVLMDMQMPVMDGIEATRKIRQLPGCNRLPIIALTANAFDSDRDACNEAGMDDFVTKPFESEILFSKILKNLPATLAQATQRAPRSAYKATDLHEIISQLRRLEGFDVEIGMRHAHNNQDLYLRLLQQFAKSTPYEQIQERLARGDRGDARIAAHSHKSLAATVGAIRESQAAADMEAMLATTASVISVESRHIAEHSTAFRSLADQLLQILAAAATQRALRSAPAGSDDNAAVDWASLLPLLDAGDVGVKSLLRQSHDPLQRAFGHAGSTVLQLVDRYEFKEAAIQLRELLAQQPTSS